MTTLFTSIRCLKCGHQAKADLFALRCGACDALWLDAQYDIPALPADWPDGYARGLRARGDFTVDVSWANGKLAEVTIEAGPNTIGKIPVVYEGVKPEINLKPGTKIELTGKDFVGKK